MASITFHANTQDQAGDTDPTLIEHTANSGLGFFGDGFGVSVPVGSYQTATYVTNADGTSSGIKCGNTMYVSASGLEHNGAAVTAGTSGTPNRYAPLNIRFTHSEAVSVKNCKLRIFDRNDITKQASGVTTKVVEFRHPHYIESFNASSGSLLHRGFAGQPGLGANGFAWQSFVDDNNVTAAHEVTFTPSPGISGLNTSASETLPSEVPYGGGTKQWLTNEGDTHKSTQHDWYVGMSASPNEIGSKTDYGLYFTLEYF